MDPRLSRFRRQPLLILPEFAAQLRPLPAKALERIRLEHRERQFRLAGLKAADDRGSGVATVGGVGVLLLFGPLSPEGECGGTSLDKFRIDLATATAEATIKRIVLYIDSPGGTYAQAPETAQAVADANRVKPIVTYTGDYGSMASGAYWIGSAATSIVATPSASAIGSIGCLVLHLEQSRLLDAAGITATILREPEGKARFNSLEPLDDTTRELIQAEVSGIYNEFVRAAVRQRAGKMNLPAVVKTDGRIFNAAQALDRGLIDKIQPWPEFLSKLRAEVRQESVAKVESTIASPRLRAAVYCGLARQGLFEHDAPPPEPSAAQVKARLDHHVRQN